jgi:hypothetical protein
MDERILKLDEVIVDNDLNPRQGALDQEVVIDYAAHVDSLPPMHCFDIQGFYYLTGGFHRYAAHQAALRTEGKFIIHQGDRVEAKEWADLDNLKHGLRLSRSERREVIRRQLKRHPDWSDARLASACSTTDKTVRVIREEMEADLVIPRLDVLTGADGIARPRTISRPAPEPASDDRQAAFENAVSVAPVLLKSVEELEAEAQLVHPDSSTPLLDHVKEDFDEETSEILMDTPEVYAAIGQEMIEAGLAEDDDTQEATDDDSTATTQTLPGEPEIPMRPVEPAPRPEPVEGPAAVPPPQPAPQPPPYVSLSHLPPPPAGETVVIIQPAPMFKSTAWRCEQGSHPVGVGFAYLVKFCLDGVDLERRWVCTNCLVDLLPVCSCGHRVSPDGNGGWQCSNCRQFWTVEALQAQVHQDGHLRQEQASAALERRRLSMFEQVVNGDTLVTANGFVSNGYVTVRVERYQIEHSGMARMLERFARPGTNPVHKVARLEGIVNPAVDVFVADEQLADAIDFGRLYYFDVDLVQLNAGGNDDVEESNLTFYCYQEMDPCNGQIVPVLAAYDFDDKLRGFCAGCAIPPAIQPAVAKTLLQAGLSLKAMEVE